MSKKVSLIDDSGIENNPDDVFECLNSPFDYLIRPDAKVILDK